MVYWFQPDLSLYFEVIKHYSYAFYESPSQKTLMLPDVYNPQIGKPGFGE